MKTKYYEENDKLAIEYSLAFDRNMEQYRMRFGTSPSENDAAAVAYRHMPEWIVPREKLLEACHYMHDDARSCHQSSLYLEFHKKLLVLTKVIFMNLLFDIRLH